MRRTEAAEPCAEQMEAWLEGNQEEYLSHVIRMSNEVTNLLTDPYDADLALTPHSASVVFLDAAAVAL